MSFSFYLLGKFLSRCYDKGIRVKMVIVIVKRGEMIDVIEYRDDEGGGFIRIYKIIVSIRWNMYKW